MAADFDEPVFDEDFVRSAVFTEPSARERARPPSRRFGPRRRDREPSHRTAVLQVFGGLLVLLAISLALWWWNSAPRDERPARPVGPTITHSPAPAPTPTAPGKGAPPTGIPEV